MSLSTGAIRILYDDKKEHPLWASPVLQVLNVKKMSGASTTGNPTDRYRLVLSDGEHFLQAMLATQLNHFAVSEQIQLRSVVRLKKHVCNMLQTQQQPIARKLLFVLDMEIVQSIVPNKIGNPVSIEPQAGAPVQQEDHSNAMTGQSVATSVPAPMQSAYGGYQQQPQQQPQQQIQQQHSAYIPQQSMPQPMQHQNHNTGGFGKQQIPQPQQPAYGGFSHNNSGMQQAHAHQQQKPPQSNFNQRAGGIEEPPQAAIFPIDALNPFQQRWTIKARVTSKSELRKWQNARGEGKVFSIDLLDESGEIRGSFFNDAAERWHPQLHENSVYYFSGGNVKNARRGYNNLKHMYEISFDNRSNITPCESDSSSVPSVRFQFVPIAEIQNVPKDSIIDVIGVVHSAESLSSVTSKTTAKQLTKRDVFLVDQSMHSIRCTLWAKAAEEFKTEDSHPVLALKGVRVGDYQGKTLSSLGTTSIMYQPEVEESYRLRGWYDSQGNQLSFAPVASDGSSGGGDQYSGSKADIRKTIEQIRDEQIGTRDKPDFCTVRGFISNLKSEGTVWYTACPEPNCNKKVIEDSDGWRCEKCQKVYSTCEYRYIFNFAITDSTGQQWIQIFNDHAQLILGHPASYLNDLKKEGRDDEFKSIFNDALFKEYKFRLRAKQEVYQDESRVRFSIMQANPISWVEESKYLLSEIQRYNV